MTVTDFIQAAISNPEALSDAGVEASRARLAEAHDMLRAARAKLVDAETAITELDGRQAALTARIAELQRKVSDRKPLIGITRQKPEALATAARRLAETEREHQYAVLALEVMITGERLPAALDVKRADLAIKQAERAWVYAKAEEITRELWRHLAAAATQDPALELTVQSDSQVASLVRDLSARDAAIEELQSAVTLDKQFIMMQQRTAGLL